MENSATSAAVPDVENASSVSPSPKDSTVEINREPERPSNGTRIVPNPSDNSFSRVILTDWLVYPGSGENPKSEILE